MTQQATPRVLWQGVIETNTMRVIDRGPLAADRLIVEIQGAPDAMGGRGWTRYEPIPRAVFQAMLIQSGVVT